MNKNIFVVFDRVSGVKSKVRVVDGLFSEGLMIDCISEEWKLDSSIEFDCYDDIDVSDDVICMDCEMESYLLMKL